MFGALLVLLFKTRRKAKVMTIARTKPRDSHLTFKCRWQDDLLAWRAYSNVPSDSRRWGFFNLVNGGILTWHTTFPHFFRLIRAFHTTLHTHICLIGVLVKPMVSPNPKLSWWPPLTVLTVTLHVSWLGGVYHAHHGSTGSTTVRVLPSPIEVVCKGHHWKCAYKLSVCANGLP